MMQIFTRVAFFIYLFLFFHSATAQTPARLPQPGDTIKTIVTDTSIVYIIKQAPVTIRQRIEIIRPIEKGKVYLSISFSAFLFSEYKKASVGYEEYLEKVNASTHNTFGYSLGASLWQCPKKIYTGLGVNLFRYNQDFDFHYPSGEIFKSDNHFNYMNMSIHLGYWFNKEKKISWIVYGGLHGDYLLSYSRYTVNKSDIELTDRLRIAMDYRKVLMDFSANIKFLVSLGGIMIEVEPYVMISPFSATVSNEAYSIQRSLVGLRVGILNPLF